MRLPFKKSYIVIILISICSYGCKKHSYDNKVAASVQLKLSTEGLAYVQPGLGKYFIYRDSTSGKLDSVTVTKSEVVNTLVSPGSGSGIFSFPASYAEIFSLTLTKFDAGIRTTWEIDFTGSANVSSIVSLDNLPVEVSDTSGVLAFAYPVCNCDASSAFPDLTVEGKSYNNVIRTIADNGADPSGPDYRRTVTYWSKGVGIIKRIKTIGPDTKTYFLIRNN